MRRKRQTLAAIGVKFGISRERVRQILKEYVIESLGMTTDIYNDFMKKTTPPADVRIQHIQVLDYTPGDSIGAVLQVPLTKGFHALIDDIDSDLLNYKWCECSGYGRGRSDNKYALMHVVILQRKLGRLLEPGEECDHWNLDRLDNRRENLRPATRSQNMANKGVTKRSKTGVKNVYWIEKDQQYLVHVGAKYVGVFPDLDDAIRARDDAAKKLYGEFART